MKPLVTITIPTRNRADLLARTLGTLVAQDYEHFRIVISDNASTDATPAVAKAFMERDPRVSYSRAEVGLDAVGSCNRALELTEGSHYFVLAGDDDLYEPEFLSRLVAVLEAQPTAALASCAVDTIDAEDRFVRKPEQRYTEQPIHSLEARASRMLWSGYGNLITGVFRRQIAGHVWASSPRRDYWDFSDMTFLFETSIAGDVLWLPDVLLHKREGGLSAQGSRRSWFERLATIAGIRRDYQRRLERVTDPVVRARLNRQVNRRVISILLGAVTSALRWRITRVSRIVRGTAKAAANG